VKAVQGFSARPRHGRCCAGASQLCSGCGSFFGWLWSLEPAVKRWIRRNGVRGAAVDDVAAEVFTVAWRRLDVVPSDQPQTERWLCAVARRTLSNQRRAMAREARRIESVGTVRRPVEQAERSADGQAHAAAERLSLLQAWRSLPPEDAEILQLVGWVGLGLDQLADRLGCRRGAAAMRLSRARRRLESLIEPPISV
jgi:RNA polymerase sigma-70 factor, ECF subfamily